DGKTPWLGLTGSLAEIPEQRYMNTLFASRPPFILVEDVESLGIMMESGVGVALLPEVLAEKFNNVIEIQPEQVGAKAIAPPLGRDIWLVTHRSRQKLPKVRAVIDWLDSIIPLL
ncbi:MAG: LysR substrate-binding domain-containing protein, partial [Planctomycetota bacterium]|nr:LysR substrate-binding domain-containing protein [Planctomycetota bacterium]